MRIKIKKDSQIVYMRKAGRIVARTLKELKAFVKPGVSTKTLNIEAEKLIINHGGSPSFKGYRGFPAAICTSLNEQVVHGIPSERILLPGDIIGIDVGVCVNGWHADAAVTYVVGDVPNYIENLLTVTYASLMDGIVQARTKNHLGDISSAIQKRAEVNGYQVVKDLYGHGIGQDIHEDPLIPNYGNPGEGVLLKAGMVLAIEPMVNIGGFEIETLSDGWTIVTKDRTLSAHFEHTVVITADNEPEILTLENL